MACNITALAGVAHAQACAAYNASMTCGGPTSGGAPPHVVPTAMQRLTAARAMATHGDPAAAARVLDALLAGQDASGRMPAWVYDLNCTRAHPDDGDPYYPPQRTWGAGASGLAAPPAHATAVLDVFYRYYGGQQPGGSAAAPSDALRWLRVSWDALFRWHAWLMQYRVVAARVRGGGGGGGAGGDDPVPGMLALLSPFESAAPVGGLAWARALRAANASGQAAWCAAVTPALSAPPPSVTAGAAYPGDASFRDAWCYTGCVVRCGYDVGCVGATCAGGGPWVSALDTAVLARASDDLATIATWLSQLAGDLPPDVTPVPAAQLSQAQEWRGLSAGALELGLFARVKSGPTARRNVAAATAAAVVEGTARRRAATAAPVEPPPPCSGWVYDGKLALAQTHVGQQQQQQQQRRRRRQRQLNVRQRGLGGASLPAQWELTLARDTLAAHAAAALGVDPGTLPSPSPAAHPAARRRRSSLERRGRGDGGPPSCDGVRWRDAVVSTLLSPAFQPSPLLPSLARTDAGFAPGGPGGAVGPVWLGANWAALGGLRSPHNDDASLAEYLAEDCAALLCAAAAGAAASTATTTTETAPHGGGGWLLPGAFNADTGAPLANSTAAFAGTADAPAWAALLLSPPTVVLDPPQEYVGRTGLVVMVVVELVVVLAVAGLCAVLGARQVARLTRASREQQRDAEAARREALGGGGKGGDGHRRGGLSDGDSDDDGVGALNAGLLVLRPGGTNKPRAAGRGGGAAGGGYYDGPGTGDDDTWLASGATTTSLSPRGGGWGGVSPGGAAAVSGGRTGSFFRGWGEPARAASGAGSAPQPQPQQLPPPPPAVAAALVGVGAGVAAVASAMSHGVGRAKRASGKGVASVRFAADAGGPAGGGEGARAPAGGGAVGHTPPAAGVNGQGGHWVGSAALPGSLFAAAAAVPQWAGVGDLGVD